VYELGLAFTADACKGFPQAKQKAACGGLSVPQVAQ